VHSNECINIIKTRAVFGLKTKIGLDHFIVSRVLVESGKVVRTKLHTNMRIREKLNQDRGSPASHTEGKISLFGL